MDVKVLTIVSVTSIIIGCTPYVGKKPEQTTPPPEKKTETVTPFTSAPAVVSSEKQTLTLIDTLNKGKEYALTESDFTPQATKSGKSTVSAVQSETVTRYRVQIMAASQPERLKEDKKKLEKQISAVLSIVQEAAYYKLYAGEFNQKSDADTLLLKIKKLGYTDAWIATVKNSVQAKQ
ncbi:MAG: SPOR domain-containing protein [Fibrobacterota bacterium]|nr:SPOR domain-containing protein [Chitinispirillaceae bacterium]